jgi:hypothetical protein
MRMNGSGLPESATVQHAKSSSIFTHTTLFWSCTIGAAAAAAAVVFPRSC